MKQKSTRESPVVVEDNDDDVSEVVQPATRNDATAKVTLSQPTNGKPAFKPKGKGKAGLSTNGHKNGTNGTEFVVIDEQDDDHPPPTKPLPSAKKGEVTRSFHRGGGLFSGVRKVERGARLGAPVKHLSPGLTRILNIFMQYKEKCEQLSESLLQLIQSRNTGPEEKLVSSKAQYEATSRGK
jgi:hypothetical protein